jgi:hypothetical protein
LKTKNEEQFFDIVDTVHCLPDIIAENNFTITKSYWVINLKYYREKWDKRFLKDEQKAF